MTEPERKYGHPRVYEILAEWANIHSVKNRDYATEADPLKNFRRAEAIGIPAWKSAFVRMGDKWGRLENLVAKAGEHAVPSERLIDTLDDMGIYCVIMKVLCEEAGMNKSLAAKMADDLPEKADVVVRILAELKQLYEFMEMVKSELAAMPDTADPYVKIATRKQWLSALRAATDKEAILLARGTRSGAKQGDMFKQAEARIRQLREKK